MSWTVEKAQEAITEAIKTEQIEIGMSYKHYKGGLYIVEALGIDEAHESPVVVYRAVASGMIWVRPLGSFCETVTYLGRTSPRFFRWMGV